MFGIGMPELVVVGVIVVVIFGGKRLPQLGKDLGEGIREWRKAGKELTDLQEDIEEEDEHA